MKSEVDFQNILRRISYPGYGIVLEAEHREGLGTGPFYLRVSCDEGLCNITGKPMGWKGRRWRLSPHMTDGEVVQTAFMAVMTANEHETREKFKYRDVTVFDPHYDIEKLVALRSQPDALKEREAA
ncbi:hypothetical protein [Tardiphaga sp. 367_B4_N1_1]|uniref:hypothetical protein n=1 Tax=Tardiphaga sp. 367_B4_N1_1 TaxID=3240777 RepID=UPI003F2391DE